MNIDTKYMPDPPWLDDGMGSGTDYKTHLGEHEPADQFGVLISSNQFHYQRGHNLLRSRGNGYDYGYAR